MPRKPWAPRDLDWHNQLHSYPFVNTFMGLKAMTSMQKILLETDAI